MKKNILLQFFAFILLFSSCDELLLEDPEFTFNEQTLFSTPESAQLALNACYGYLSGTGMYGQVLNIQAEGCTGISWGRKAPGHRNFEYASLNVLPTNLILRLFWNGSYKTISECNIFIDIVEKSTLDNREHLVAQAKFLRALTYYNLAFMHGGVPLKIAPPTTPSPIIPIFIGILI